MLKSFSSSSTMICAFTFYARGEKVRIKHENDEKNIKMNEKTKKLLGTAFGNR